MKRFNRKAIRIGLGAVATMVAVFAANQAQAVVTDIDYLGPTSGTVNWNAPANWTGSEVPDTSGTSGEAGVIGDVLTGNRTIELPANLQIAGMTWNYDAASTGVDTLQLQGDVLVDGRGATVLFTGSGNASGDKANMVLDLNGHNFDTVPSTGDGGRGDGAITSYDITIKTSAPGGVVEQRAIGAANAVIQSGVTVIINGGSLTQSSAGTWEDGSTFHLAKPGTTSGYRWERSAPGGFYDVIVGFEDGSPAAPVTHRQLSGRLQIRNNLTINLGTNWGWFDGNENVAIGGNFTDPVAGDYLGADGDFFFNGGGPQQLLNVTRTGITNAGFNIGEGVTPGNVALVNDLTTQDVLTITDTSTLDLRANTATAGDVTITDGATISIDFNDLGNGQIVASDIGIGTGDLSLDGFTLNLEATGFWTSYTTLVLMTYDGTLTGTPVVTIGNAPFHFQYDELLTDNGQIRLTGVFVPEPAGLSIIAIGTTLLTMRKRKHLRS